MASAKVTLGRDGMGDGADEVDFDAWVTYVAEHIEEKYGYPVDVSEKSPRDVQNDAIFDDEANPDNYTIRDAIQDLWNDFCADPSAWPARKDAAG